MGMVIRTINLFLGKYGHDAAELTVNLLKGRIKEDLLKIENELKDEEKVKNVLKNISEDIQIELEESNFSVKYSGTTLVIALIIKNKLFFCNIGDSRAILISKGSSGRLWTTMSTEDHNPENKEERKRIEESGGVVSPLLDENGTPYGPERVWNQEITEPGLAMSRSLGDTLAHEFGVSNKPGKRTLVLIILRFFCEEIDS